MQRTSIGIIAACALTGLALLGQGCDEDHGGLPDPDAGPPLPDAGVDSGDAAPAEPECPTTTTGPTLHSYDVADDETWTAETGPHVVEYDVNVRNGAKLTIEPCARVELAAGKHIHVAYPGTPNVGGTLIAEGTAKRPILFTARGDQPWASIYVNAPGTARLAHVTLENGGGGDFESGSTLNVLGDQVLPADPLLFVDHVTVRKSVGHGVWMQRGATFIAGSASLTVTASGNEAFPFPVRIDEHAIDAFPSGSYTGNRIDEILLKTYGYGVAGGGLVVDATLHERGVPYRMGDGAGDDFTVGPSDDRPAATLTIEPGVVMRFAPEAALRVHAFTEDAPARAAIRAIGTAAKPIVFTSAAATPAAGDWRGLWFGARPLETNRLDHVRIEYAGAHCGCSLNTCSNVETSHGAIVFTGQIPSAFVTNSVFLASAGHGVTQGFDGAFVNFRPTNTFDAVAGCVQPLPRSPDTSCADPRPACDGL